MNLKGSLCNLHSCPLYSAASQLQSFKQTNEHSSWVAAFGMRYAASSHTALFKFVIRISVSAS
ncbi:hypothetical protein HanRHA438_Chr08g0349581 [Helianthus annuus]|nr:hypothetical protein HanRHA438_Chr08g0349581 [Helianthus annuus]